VTLLLTTLQEELTQASRRAKKTQTLVSYSIERRSKLGYFKAIKRAKASYRADFLATTAVNNIWTAKQLVAPRKLLDFPPSPTPRTQSQSTTHFWTTSSPPRTP